MDKLTKQKRSENMRKIKSKGMKPELLVRSLVHKMGFRFRLHSRDLPGKPDLVFASRKKVIFVHGCFWHQHNLKKCLDGRMPKSNLGYWVHKLESNMKRDKKNTKLLKVAGWKVQTIWDCELKNEEKVRKKITAFLNA